MIVNRIQRKIDDYLEQGTITEDPVGQQCLAANYLITGLASLHTGQAGYYGAVSQGKEVLIERIEALAFSAFFFQPVQA